MQGNAKSIAPLHLAFTLLHMTAAGKWFAATQTVIHSSH